MLDVNRERHQGILVVACLIVLLLGTTATTAGVEDGLSDRMQEFLEHDAHYLLKGEERSLFLSLTTELERQLFVERFWKSFDPEPATPENEFRDEHLRRMARANRKFRDEGLPGWKTDRGRVFVLYGEPEQTVVQDSDSIEAQLEIETRTDVRFTEFPERGLFHAGRTAVRGKQVWYYHSTPQALQDLGSRITFRKTPLGRWVLSDAREPRAGGPFDRGVAVTDFENSHPPRREIADVLNETSPLVDELQQRAIQDMTNDGIFSASIALDSVAFYFPLSDEETLVPVAVQARPSGDAQNVGPRARLFGLVRQGYGSEARTVEEFQDSLLLNSENGIENLAFSLALAPGRYQLYLGLVDASSGKLGTTARILEVPRFETTLKLSSIVLAQRYRNKPGNVASSAGSGELDMGEFALSLEPRFRFHREQTAEVYFEVTGSGEEFSVEYQFWADGQARTPVLERRSALPSVSQPLPLSAFELSPGDYVLRVLVRDLESGRTARNEAPLTILE